MTGFAYLAIKAVAIALAGICLMAVAGLAYQSISQAADDQRYIPPGRLVDIGGRRLHLLCAGQAAGPTVVIEAGSGNDSMFWDGMVGRVSAFTHVCAYDRAGLGWSDAVSGPRSFDDRAADLHALLTKADIAGPYVLVGHSYGGYIVRRFAAAYPASVAGMVLVDAPDEEFSFAPEGLRDAADIGAREWRLGWLIRLGLLRLGIALFPDRFDPLKNVPAEVHGEMTALFLRSSRHFAVADEMAAYGRVPPARRVAYGFGRLGDMPLVVVSRAAQDPVTGVATFPEWQEAQARLAALSTKSTRIIAEKSGHMIQFTQPALIVEAIHRVLADISENAHG
jgi:pimeloyl-ACP methyl ester carboxylesterase